MYYPFTNSATTEVWEKISNFIQNFIEHVILARAVKLIHASKRGTRDSPT